MTETKLATNMDEQKTMFAYGFVLPMIIWLFAADGFGRKIRFSFKEGAQAMQLPSRPKHFTPLLGFIQLQQNCYSCDSEGENIKSDIGPR